MGTMYARAKNAVAVCNRSGQKMLRKDMVEDGYLKGMLVHPDWWDPYHPQERPFDPDEPIAIYRPAPDLMPFPPMPVLYGVLADGQAQLSWEQPDPPGSTMINWTVWRSTTGATGDFTLLATIPFSWPNAYMVSPADLLPGDPPITGYNKAGTIYWNASYTDATWQDGYAYYVQGYTSDTSEEGIGGLLTPPSNILTETMNGFWGSITAETNPTDWTTEYEGGSGEGILGPFPFTYEGWQNAGAGYSVLNGYGITNELGSSTLDAIYGNQVFAIGSIDYGEDDTASLILVLQQPANFTKMQVTLSGGPTNTYLVSAATVTNPPYSDRWTYIWTNAGTRDDFLNLQSTVVVGT